MQYSIIPESSLFRKVLRLALPMAGTNLMTMSSGFLCMGMIAQLGHIVLAASALIFSVNLSLFATGMSLLFSVSILTGHAYGAQDYRRVGSLLQQGWLVALVISVPIALIFWNIYPILIFFGQDPRVAAVAKTFFHANIGTVPLALLSVANQQFFYAVHQQRLDMAANGLGVVVVLTSANILIFGKYGFHQWGVAGLGYANTLQSGFYFLFTLSCLYSMNYFKKFDVFFLRILEARRVLKQLLKTGWPITLQIGGEMLSFLVCAVFVGWLGTVPLAAYQVMMQYEFLSVIPIFAVSQASGVLIGHAVGGERFSDIKKLGTASLQIAVGLSLLAAIALIGFPQTLAAFYLNIHDPFNAKVLHLVIQLFAVLALSQALDAVRNVLIGLLRGLLDMRFPMIVGLLCIWLISVPLGYVFAFPCHGGAVGAMFGWSTGLFISIVILWHRWRVMAALKSH